MATYLILNTLFIISVCIVLRLVPRRPSKSWIATLLGLLLLTAIFDNVIIGLQIVGYDNSLTLGYRFLLAPIEDFMYALLAVILVPALWHKLGASHDR